MCEESWCKGPVNVQSCGLEFDTPVAHIASVLLARVVTDRLVLDHTVTYSVVLMHDPSSYNLLQRVSRGNHANHLGEGALHVAPDRMSDSGGVEKKVLLQYHDIA